MQEYKFVIIVQFKNNEDSSNFKIFSFNELYTFFLYLKLKISVLKSMHDILDKRKLIVWKYFMMETGSSTDVKNNKQRYPGWTEINVTVKYIINSPSFY